MRYDVNSFQFILNLMEVMCLVQECMKCSVKWLKSTVRIRNSIKGIETCNSMLVKHFRSRAIVGHWYPIVSIDFHEHALTGMMCWGSYMPYFLYLLMQGSLSKGWTTRDGGANWTWKVSDCMEGVTEFPMDCVAEKGRSWMDLFWSLALRYGIKCTSGVHPGTMNR